MAKVTFLGLGVMGFPMAGHLSEAGHSVTVFNRSKEKAELWKEKYTGEIALTPRIAAKGSDYVMACVGNDNDLREVCLGQDGALEGMKNGSIFIDHTTVKNSGSSWTRCRCERPITRLYPFLIRLNPKA